MPRKYQLSQHFLRDQRLALKLIGHSNIKKRDIVIESGEGDYANILVYVIPHTLPSTNDIYKTRPFKLTVKVSSGKTAILNKVFDVNQWSGDNITLNKVGCGSEQ